MFRLTDEQAKSRCKFGEGERCCRYLMVGLGGFQCAKSAVDVRNVIDLRFAEGMNAKGDNCAGPDKLRFVRNARGGFQGGDRFRKGTVVFAYHGCTYGCLGETDIAISMESGKGPFIGIPADAVEPVPFDEESASDGL